MIKRTSIYYTGPKTQPVAETSLSVSSIAPSTRIALSPLKPCNIDTTKPQVTSSVRKQVAWADQGNDWLASIIVHVLVCLWLQEYTYGLIFAPEDYTYAISDH